MSEATESKAHVSVKRKRIYHLVPELRSQVPSMFDRMREDDVAEQFGIPVRDVLAESLRDLRRQLRKGPQSETRPAMTRMHVIGGRTA